MKGAAASAGARIMAVLALATLLLLFASAAEAFRMPNAHSKPSGRSACKSLCVPESMAAFFLAPRDAATGAGKAGECPSRTHCS